MSEFSAGDVIVPVVPSARGFINDLRKEILPGAYKLGQDIGRDIQRGISDNLKGVYEPLKEQTQRQRQQAPKDGEEVAGAFARGFKSRLQAAFQSLPKAEVDADTTGADAALAGLRARMAELGDKKIGVDISAADALAEVATIRRELEALDGKDVSPDVRVDIAAALAELTAVQAMVANLDGRVARPRVDVDVAGALRAIGLVSAALAGLAAIPVGASLGAGLLALSGPLAAAGVGFGGLAAVAVPSVGRITEALKAQEQASEAAARSTKSGAQAAAEAASSSLQLEQAQRRIADAERDAEQAEAGLTRARQDAKRAMDDLRRSVEDARLSQEDAALSVREAQERLNEVLADPKATDLQRERADLSYRQAVRRLEDQKRRTKDLENQQKASDKAGIEGSDQVKAAKDRLTQANQKVKDAEAQLKLLRLQQAAAAAREAKATGGVVDKLAKLSPAAKTAAKQVKAFQDAYLSWQKKLEPTVLPAITGGLKLIRSLFKPLLPIVSNTAIAFGGLLDSAREALTQPFWTDFFTQLSDWIPTAVGNLGRAFGNIIKGIAGIVKAFLPFTGEVTGGLESITAKFADWGESLGQSEGFKSFIAYVRENAPKVIQVVSNIFTVVKNLLSGLAGDGPGVLDLIVKITDYLASLSPETLRAIALGALGVVAAFKAWKVITTAVDGVKKSIDTASSIIEGTKKAWAKASDAASKAKDVIKGAASRITTAVKGLGKGAGKVGTAVWTGIRSAATKTAMVAKTSASVIAGAARSAGQVAVKGATAAWSGIQVAAGRAASAAKIAASAIVSAGRTAAVAAVSVGRVAASYAAVALQAGLAAARQVAAAAAMGIIRAATIAWTAVQWVLNAALSANPIGLVVVAITALVAALIYAWNNSETFRTIVLAAWAAIQAGIKYAWENVIKPALDALVWLWKNVIAPAATWLWKNVLAPAFTGIGLLIKTAWTTVIKPALDALVNLWRQTLAPAATWLWKTIIKPAWDGISGLIKTAWDKILKPVFEALVKWVMEDVPKAFKAGVDLIGRAWDKVKDVAKAPVKFIIDVVYNNGIVKIWNAVADILGLKDLKLSPIQGFAKGGIYPGYTPGKDVGFAAVSGGEAIMRPEWTRAVGEDYVHKMNAAARSGGVGGVARALGVAGDPGPFMGAFAGGGIVDGIKDLLAGGLKAGAEAFLNPLLDKAGKAMGDSPWAKLLVGVPKKMVANVISWIGKHDTGSGDGGKALSYAKAQIGKPYQWGATGPDSFDCSGLVMRAWQSAGVTDIPRTTYQQIPWVKAVKKPQPGDLGFPHDGHVWMYSKPVSKIVEAPYTGAKVRETAARAAMLIGRPPSLFDSGGYLPPGSSLVHNGTGRPEPVLTDRQWAAIASAPTRGGDAPLVNVENMSVTPEQSTMGIAKDLRYLLGSQVRQK